MLRSLTFAVPMSELSSISNYCGQRNLPGLQVLKYLPLAWLDQGEYEEIISATGNFQRTIAPTLGGEAWLTLPFFPSGDGWRQGNNKTEQGDKYPQEVAGIIPMLRPEVEAEFGRMAPHLFLVQFIDRNGKPWLIGRATEPLEFVASNDSGSTSGGLNSYTFRFFGTTSKRAWGYSPVF